MSVWGSYTFFFAFWAASSLILFDKGVESLEFGLMKPLNGDIGVGIVLSDPNALNCLLLPVFMSIMVLGASCL